MPVNCAVEVARKHDPRSSRFTVLSLRVNRASTVRLFPAEALHERREMRHLLRGGESVFEGEELRSFHRVRQPAKVSLFIHFTSITALYSHVIIICLLKKSDSIHSLYKCDDWSANGFQN